LLKVCKIVATSEYFAGAGDDTATNFWIAIGVVNCCGQRAVGRQVDGVSPLRPIDGQQADAIRGLIDPNGHMPLLTGAAGVDIPMASP
jgi:hypothetical protein